MIDQNRLDEIKQGLIARQKLLKEELDRLAKEPAPEKQSQDDGDHAVTSTLETLRNSIQNAEYEEFVMIDAALKSIEDGTYGVCRDCEQGISEKRLKYYPNAQRCLACQEAAEVSSI